MDRVLEESLQFARRQLDHQTRLIPQIVPQAPTHPAFLLFILELHVKLPDDPGDDESHFDIRQTALSACFHANGSGERTSFQYRSVVQSKTAGMPADYPRRTEDPSPHRRT